MGGLLHFSGLCITMIILKQPDAKELRSVILCFQKLFLLLFLLMLLLLPLFLTAKSGSKRDFFLLLLVVVVVVVVLVVVGTYSVFSFPVKRLSQ